jgi:hypothetical protein
MPADTVSKLKKAKVFIFSACVAALRERMLFAGFTGLRATLGKNQDVQSAHPENSVAARTDWRHWPWVRWAVYNSDPVILPNIICT